MRNLTAMVAGAVLMVPAAAIAQTAAPVPAAAGAATATPATAATTPAAAATAATAATPATGPSTNVQLGADGKVALTAGTPVIDPKGGNVGWIESVSGGTPGNPETAVLKTRASRVTVTAASFARTDKAAVIGMTEADVDKAAAGTAGGSASSATGTPVPPAS